MNADIKKEWLERLRSGQDVQGRNRLKNAQGEMCCLNVLCEIAVKHGIIEPAQQVDGNKHSEYYYVDGVNGKETGILPFKVAQWAGIDSVGTLPRGHYIPNLGEMPYHYPTTLMQLNDDARLTFPQIADVIEKAF